MASKKPAGDAAKGGNKDDLFAQFDDVLPKDKAKSSGGSKAGAKATKAKDADPLADLEGMASKGSRPQTPRPGSSAKKPPAAGASARTSEDRAGAGAGATGATAVETQPSESTTTTKDAAPTTAEGDDGTTTTTSSSSAGGGWWGGFGGLVGAASAAVRQAQSQAESIAKELQKNEEAQKWAEHVKGNAALLRSYGGDLRHLTGELRSRALPGLTNLLHTLAPPISSHERLQVHITHDLTGYPSLDPLVHAVFVRVMAQVEGGDLLVLQRGHESSPKAGASGDEESSAAAAASSTAGGGIISTSTAAGWSDGPWWRDTTRRRDMGAVHGLVEASKLARASAEAYADEHFARRGESVDAARDAHAATTVANESNPTRSSDIFLAIQPVIQTPAPELFGGGASSSEGKGGDKEKEGEKENDNDDLLFAIYLHDPVHRLAFSAVTQPVPAKWMDWLDLPADRMASAEKKKAEQKGKEKEGDDDDTNDASEEPSPPPSYLPPDIAEAIAAGGVDPREWAAEWIEECLALGVGIVAQRYVARRMGVGELPGAADIVAGARTGKAEEAGAGELARAM